MFVLRLRAPAVASPVRFAAPFASLLFAPLAGAAGARGASCVRSSSSILPRRSPAVPSSAPAIISGAGPSLPVPPRLPLLRFGASIRWRSAHAPASLVSRLSSTLGHARQLLPTTAGGFGALVAVYGSWRMLVWAMSASVHDVFETGFVAGGVTVLAVGAGLWRAWSRTYVAPDAAFTAAMALVDESPVAEAALGTNIRAGELKAYTSTRGHVQAHRGLAWVEPRIQLLFQVVGELGTAMVTAEAVQHRGHLVFTVVALDILASPARAARVVVLLGSEDKLHVRGTLRGFLQTERAAFITLDKAAPADEDLVAEQSELEVEQQKWSDAEAKRK